jgi:ADP-heptose:LPS heptosyltransferase
VTRPGVVTRFGRPYLQATWHSNALVDGLAVVDLVLRPFHPAPPAVPVGDLRSATIAIAKTDHLGDLIQATALLRALRTRLPDARLALVHGSWSRELADWLVRHDYVHELVQYDPVWLNPARVSWRARVAQARATRADAARRLRALAPAVFLDIRCTSPHALDLAIESGAPCRIGYGLRGRGWQYHRHISFVPSVALGQNWLHALDALGLPPATYSGPVLPACGPLAASAPIVVQPGSKTPAKEVPIALWAAILPRLAEHAPIVMVGTRGERQRWEALSSAVSGNRLTNTMGDTSVAELIALVARARAVVGVESVAAHLGIGYGRPVVVLDRARASGRQAFPEGADRLAFVDADTNTSAVVERVLASVTAR